MNTTNYYDTFIEISADSPVTLAEVPPQKGDRKTVANLQFEMISANPYLYTSDDVIFSVYAEKNGVDEEQFEKQRDVFFQRASLVYVLHPYLNDMDGEFTVMHKGKIAIFPVESEEYKNFQADSRLHHVKAMRSKRQ